MKLSFLCLLLFAASPLLSNNLPSSLAEKGVEILFNGRASFSIVQLNTSDDSESSANDTIRNHPSDDPVLLRHRTAILPKSYNDTVRLIPLGSVSIKKRLDELTVKNSLTKNLLGYFITSRNTTDVQPGVKSTAYFNQFEGKKIASISFIRLHPFGTSLMDPSLDATKWTEKAGNRLHMNTVKSKLRMQLLFDIGQKVNPQLMAENEKVMRDLNYIEDVSFRLESVNDSPDEVNVTVISKDKFEYAFSMSLSAKNSDVELVNENMFGLGHQLNVGMAQENSSLPEMGIYFSYHVNNILGHFINSTVGYSNTYLKEGWNIAIEKKFLTSLEENAGGFSYEHIDRYNHITDNHPIELDTMIAYVARDFWFMHAFSNTKNQYNKTLISLRYYHQKFNLTNNDLFSQSKFIRNRDFFLASLSFAQRNLYKNNLIYGYGVTEDIPFGHYYELTAGLDKSQYGTWPYLGLSLSKAFIDNQGRYYSGKFAIDGFFDNRIINQGAVFASANFFTRKFFAFGDPFRGFINIEFLSGINRFREEYLTIDGRFGIRDFYTNDLKGNTKLKLSFEAVRYLRWNLHGFKFTNYLFTDIAFLSDRVKSFFQHNFYTGIGTGFRIYNESLVFKVIDIRLSWFPLTPPEGIRPFGANLQGLTKSRFDDFLGRQPQTIRYQ